jgi:hypothetical protein
MTSKASPLAPVILVGAVGALLGLFIWRAYVVPVTLEYPLDFAGSKTISASPSDPAGYFRRTIYIPTAVRQAWLAVASSDSFVLRVNGKYIGRGHSFNLVAQDVFDLSLALSSGKNVIAVEVDRVTYPGPAWLRVRGGYSTADGVFHSIETDQTWKANNRLKDLIRGEMPSLKWYAVDYDDTLWPRALIYPTDKAPGFPVFCETWPAVFATPPKGPWLWGPEVAASRIHLQHSLYVSLREPEKIWIRISGLCPYRLSLNENVIAIRADSSPVFDLYDLKPVLQWGENQIGLDVQRAPGEVGVLVELFVERTSGELTIFRDASQWKLPPRPGQIESTTPVSLGTYTCFPKLPLLQSVQVLNLPWWSYWWSGITLLLFTAGTGLLVVGHWRFWEAIWGRKRDGSVLRRRLAFFHLPAGLFLVVIFFLGFDIRILPDWPFHTRFILIAIVLLVGGQLLGSIPLNPPQEDKL